MDAFSRAPDQDSGDEHQHAPDDHLESRGENWRIHVVLANPGDGREFHRDHRNGRQESDMEARDEEGQRVTDASERRHQAAHDASNPRVATSGERTIVGERFGESHADAGADRGGESDGECVVAAVSGEGRGENRLKRGDRAIHQTCEPRLDNLEHEQTPIRFFFFGLLRCAELLCFEILGAILVVAFFLRKIVEELANVYVLRLRRRSLVEASCFGFHGGSMVARRIDTESLDQPHRAAVHESLDVLAANQRDVFAKLLVVQIEQAAAMAGLLHAHAFEDGGTGGEVLAEFLGDGLAKFECDRPLAEQTLTIDTELARSHPFTGATNLLHVRADAPCMIAIDNPSVSTELAANAEEYFAVLHTSKLTVVRNIFAPTPKETLNG